MKKLLILTLLVLVGGCYESARQITVYPYEAQPQNNYWQEEYARQQYQLEQQRQYQINIHPQPSYNPDAWKPIPPLPKR